MTTSADVGTSGDVGQAIRAAGAEVLAQALRDSRRDTLATFAAVDAALAQTGQTVPQRAELNPPLWELGHTGWFQSHWLALNNQRPRGFLANPDAPRPSCPGDALYDSSRVPHASRWSLPLPDADATRATLDKQLAQTLALLQAMQEPLGAQDAQTADAALYFFRLALLHEDMHHEAALTMAQSLGLQVDDPRWRPQSLADANPGLAFEAGPWRLGFDGPGFGFDNELGAHELALPACQIDSRVVRWAEYLLFVEAGGYTDVRWWSAAGGAWLAGLDSADKNQADPRRDDGRQAHHLPRYLRRRGAAWQQQRHGEWLTLDANLPACHLSYFEAQAWCHWAGRRLPTEAEWERAACCQAAHQNATFAWGEVWEWTSTVFNPYPGFVAHPYRDYSAPWFGSRQVLRGASRATQPRMHHPRYRNFFTAERTDIFAGFRSCAI